MKTYSITLVLLTSITSVLGCGGGEEDKSTSQQVAKTTPQMDSPPEQTITTGDLISLPEFDLHSASELHIGLPASPSAITRYFINICTDFSNEDSVISINYDSCKLRTALTITEQQFTLSLSAAENLLIAQIWPIENDAQPVNIYWNIAESGNNWQLSF